jgi:endonuclease-3 related protein
MNPLKIYKKLDKKYGAQGWWPILERTENCGLGTEKGYKSVYKKRTKLSESEMFEIAVGAILTQNTSWRNVETALANLKRSRFLSPVKIARLQKSKLCQLIRPSGYFNQKTKKLIAYSKWLIENYDGKMKKFFKKPLDEARKELLNLWGIGLETADSILLYAGSKPVFVIDAYTKRLCKKYRVEFKTYDQYREYFEKRLPKSSRLFNEFHALIVREGKNL